MDDSREYLKPPHIDPPSQETLDILAGIPPEEWKRNPTYQNALKEALKQRKDRKRYFRTQWLSEHWIDLAALSISFLSLIISVIALLK